MQNNSLHGVTVLNCRIGVLCLRTCMRFVFVCLEGCDRVGFLPGYDLGLTCVFVNDFLVNSCSKMLVNGLPMHGYDADHSQYM